MLVNNFLNQTSQKTNEVSENKDHYIYPHIFRYTFFIHLPKNIWTTFIYWHRGEAARKEAAQAAEVAAQQESVMAAVEAESKQETVVQASAVSQV